MAKFDALINNIKQDLTTREKAMNIVLIPEHEYKGVIKNIVQAKTKLLKSVIKVEFEMETPDGFAPVSTQFNIGDEFSEVAYRIGLEGAIKFTEMLAPQIIQWEGAPETSAKIGLQFSTIDELFLLMKINLQNKQVYGQFTETANVLKPQYPYKNWKFSAVPRGTPPEFATITPVKI